MTRNMITKLITTAALAVLVGTGSTSTAEAQHVRLFDGVTFAAVVPGQTLRFTVMNLTTQAQGGHAIRARVLLYDENGNVIARSQDVEVSPGEFRAIDFKHEDLSADGDSATGRIEMRGSIVVLLGDGSARMTPPEVSVYAMVIDPRTGQTIHVYPRPVSIRVGAVDRF